MTDYPPAPEPDAPPYGSRRRRRLPVPVLAIVAALLAAIAVAGAFWRAHPPGSPSAATRTGGGAHRALLFVRPFDDLSPQVDRAYVSDGLTEELITQLGRMYPQGLGVIARTTAMAYAKTPDSIAQIGRDLDVDYVLEGSVRIDGPKAVVTAQLVQVRDRTILWADHFERDRMDLAAMQREVAQEVARVLAVKLLPRRDVALARVSTGSGPAYDAYLRGREHLRHATARELAAGVVAFRQATRDDPDFALAWVGLAEAYLEQRSRLLTEPETAGEQAGDAARRAVAIDPALAEAHAALGEVLSLHDARDPAAEAEFRRAIVLNPSDVLAHCRYARLLLDLERPDPALAEIDRAIALDPRAARLRAVKGWIHYRTGDDDRATTAFEAALAIDPALPFGHYGLGRIAERHARFDEAIEQFGRAREASDGAAKYLSALGDVYAKTGEVARARAMLRALQTLAMTRYVSPEAIRDLSNEIGRAEALAAAQRADRAVSR